MRSLLILLVWTVLAVPAAVFVFPWTLITRNPALLFRVGFWITRVGLPCAGVRVVVRGRDQLPEGATIVMANHVSNLDPPVLIPLMPPRMVIYLKASLMRIPVLGYAMRLAGFIPVTRDGTVESAKASSAAALLALQQQRCVVVFPEGTRSRDGAMLSFKKGPFFLAMESGAPVTPVSIADTRKLLPKGKFNLRAGTVTVTFHPPIRPADYAEREALMGAVRAAIESGLNEG